jgi:hypothetical protein
LTNSNRWYFAGIHAVRGFSIMGQRLWLIAAFLACQAAAATAADRASTVEPRPSLGGEKGSGRAVAKDTRQVPAAPLDRVAIAVHGAESSHGRDLAMWRPDPSGPQGPMQVSEAAATDVGGGDRFDMEQNRVIGRAYLTLLHQRYGNWPDAIAAYNWGIGRMDAWLKAGRPPDKLDGGVAVYLRRVLNDSGLCAEPTPVRRRSGEPVAITPDTPITAACIAGEGWRGGPSIGFGPSRFIKKLEQAAQLTVLRAAGSP